MADNMDYATSGGLISSSISDTADTVRSADPVGADKVHYPKRLPKTQFPGAFWSYTCEKCEEVVIREGDNNVTGVENGAIIHSYPDRCNPCDREVKRVGRMLDLKEYVSDRHELLRNPKVGFLTLTLPGEYPGRIVENVRDGVLESRKLLYEIWGKFWRNYLKKHCEGAYRFFEWTERVDKVQHYLDDSDPTTVDYRIHPHLHVLVLQEGITIDIRELREKAIAAGFGSQIDMEWRGDRSGLGSIDYCLSYVKKDLQIEGRNRQGYGSLYGKDLPQ